MPVFAITDGVVVRSGWVSGYGGMVAISHIINNEPHIAIYGHLDPNQLPKLGEVVSTRQKIGILGYGFTTETDNERKHLHFAVHKGSTINVAGYVQDKTQLDNWVNAESTFYQEGPKRLK